MLEKYVLFGNGFNPHSLSFMSLAFGMLPLIFGIFCLLERSKYTKWNTLFTGWIEKHTISIFISSSDFGKYYATFFSNLLTINIWAARFLYFAGMIFGAVLI